MNITRLIFEILLIYIVYKVIFDFIIPLYTTTKQIKGKVNDMQQKMYQQQQQQREMQEQQRRYEEQRAAKSRIPDDDYIDYEEVK